MARILIVDDLAVNRDLLVAILRRSGHLLLEARDGLEALDVAHREHPDLVITDVLMPSMDGFELVRQLRVRPDLAHLPVIFCTAHYWEQEAQRLAESCGVSHVIMKPCDPKVVLRVVDTVLGGAAPAAPSVVEPDFDREHLRLVTDKLSATVSELRGANARLEALVDLGLQFATERDPVALLEGCCRAGRDLLGARYAVLAVWDERLPQGEHYATSGLSEPALESLRQGLANGRLFSGAPRRSFRMANPGGKPEALGLPSPHPPIEAIVAAPIDSLSRGYGWMYLAGWNGSEAFTDDDERLIRIMAGQVGRIYENGGLLREAQRQADRLAGEVAERRRAEEALRHADERTKFALEAGGVGIWEYVPRAGSLTWSDTLQRIHGLAPGTFGGTPDAFYACVHPDHRAAVRRWIEYDLPRDAESEIEYRAVWPDGTVRQIVGKGRLLRRTNGEVTVIGGVATDVTEQRHLEARLLQAQKMEAVGQLAGGVAHDFNNLLTAILGYAELVADELEPDSPHLPHIQQIVRSGVRATHLTRQLLAFSRRQILQPRIVDLNALVKELSNMLRRLIGEDVELTLALDARLPPIKADPGQIEQVIVNLAVNARDAMPMGGRLTIETGTTRLGEEFFRQHGIVDEEEALQMVRLAVGDTGTGIDPATRRHIFEPFFTTKPRGKGTGLGLSTVYGIVKQSGGFISVDSEPNHGATFQIFLPPAAAEIGADAPEPVPAMSASRGAERILLVEDEDAVRLLVRTMLEQRGYRVLEAAEGDAALRAAREDAHPIDLLISDVILPGLSGPELFEQLRPTRPGLKVLYLSGYSDETIARRGILAPEVPYLPKPFTGAGLAQKVREVLDMGTSPSR